MLSASWRPFPPVTPGVPQASLGEMGFSRHTLTEGLTLELLSFSSLGICIHLGLGCFLFLVMFA